MPATILIADDDASARDLLSFLLTDEGYSLRFAGDGREALDLAHQKPPDLIITDLAMPTMDGLELIKELHDDPTLRGVPILVVSAYLRSQLAEAMRAGADAGLRKPIDPDDFIRAVMNLLPPAGP